LEKTCRNPRPTMLSGLPGENIVRVPGPIYAISFDELLEVLAS